MGAKIRNSVSDRIRSLLDIQVVICSIQIEILFLSVDIVVTTYHACNLVQ